MIRFSSTLAAELREHAYMATSAAYHDAEALIAKHKAATSQREAWHVAQLCASVRQLANSWRGAIAAEVPRTTLSMSSVFTHQKPYVKWTHSRAGRSRCELADLLIAVIDRRAAPAKGVAILVQAKNAEGGRVHLKTTSEITQFELLSQRPTFDVDASPGPTKVDLRRYSPDAALLYGLADQSPHFLGAWGSPLSSYILRGTWLTKDSLGRLPATPSPLVIASESLASVLVDLLRGACGWEFELPPGGHDWSHFAVFPKRDDWSMLINFLLEDTFKGSMSPRLAIPVGQGIRGKEEQLFFSAMAPRTDSMFLITDGYSHLRQFATATGGGTDTPQWRLASFDNWGGDGGGPGQTDTGENAPEGGPISALIIELGSKD
jgi:hypothetical protein